MIEFTVGQVVYLPRLDGRSVERVTVERITISTDKPGEGGPYCYPARSDAWQVCYALSNGSNARAGGLFDDPAAAFRHIEPTTSGAA